jgi:hypothetical protein
MGVRFVMVGGLAVGVHGHERYTKAPLLELDAAVGAGAVDQGGGGAAGGAGQVLGVLGDGDRDGREALAREAIAPVAAQQRGQGRQLVLLDQEVCLGPSTLAGAGRTADQRGDAGREAAIAQRLHLGDRAGHRGDQRQTVEQLFGGGRGEVGHLSEATAKFAWLQPRNRT